MKFNYINSNITEENFPKIKREIKGYKIFHFNKYISSEDVMKEMQKEGYEPATIWELMDFKKWKWNEKDFVVALGSVALFDGGRHVGYLNTDSDGRYVGLYYYDGDWGDYYRFLAVRTVSPKSLSSSLTLGNLDTLPNELNINGVVYIKK